MTVVSASVLRRLASTLRLGRRVERRRGVVEQQQRGTANQRSSQGDALTLATRQADATLADDGVQPVGQLVRRRLASAVGQRGAHRVVVHGQRRA